jgi:hypothetical protein
MALTVWFGIPEISGRATERRERAPGVLALLRDGVRYVTDTPLVRGLVLGIIGAFAAGGTIIGSGTLYAASLSGGNAAYGLLFAAVFAGLAAGMGGAPQLARRLPRSRLFGAAIVAAGVALVGVALAPHLAVALVGVALVGGFAGVAFLTGLTIIGAEVEDAVRGRVVAFVQSIVRLTLLGSMALVPVVVGLVGVRPVELFGRTYLVDGTRIVMLVGGAVAVVVGLLAHRQMDDRRTGLLPVLLAALRRTELPRTAGLLIAVEGVSGTVRAGRAARRPPARRRVRRRRAGRVRRPGALVGRRPRGRARRGPGAGAGRRRGAVGPGGAGGPARARPGRGGGGRPVRRQPARPVRRGGRRGRSRGARRAGAVGHRPAAARRHGAAGRRHRHQRDAAGRGARPRAEAAGADGRGRAPALPGGAGGGRPRRGGATRARRARPAAAARPRHRPGDPVSVWDEVVGQPAAVAELSAAARDPAAMTHAWLFTGPPGSGRSVAARAFAAALQCPEQGCGHCAACHTVLSGTHADVREIVPEGLSIGVKETKQVVQNAARHPSTGPTTS